MNNKKTMGLSTTSKIVLVVYMLLTIIIALYPLVWVFTSSLKADPLLDRGFLPSKISVEGYKTVFTELDILVYFRNSFFTALISVILSIGMVTMSSYVLSRYRFKGRTLVELLFYSTLFIPATAMTFPVYNLVRQLGIFNTPVALIFVYSCSGIAMSFFVIKNYFDTIPKELEEAAFLDGCGYVQTFFHIMMPIARPGIITAAVLAFMNNWNEYYWSSMLVIKQEYLTIPALLTQFRSGFETNYNGLFAAIVVIVLPPILVFILFSKYFVEALGGGAVKG